MHSEESRNAPRLGPAGRLLDVPENQDFIRRLRSTPSLTPIQLIRLSKVYRQHPVHASLADHLFVSAMRNVALTWKDVDERPTRYNAAITSIIRAVTEDGTADHEENLEPTAAPPSDSGPDSHSEHAPEHICEFKCTWWTVFFIGTGLLWEDCGHGWHVIGVCLSS